jgi:lipid IVA palmitoyltransferase
MGMQRWARPLAWGLVIWLGAAAPARAAECADLWDWLNKACRRVVDTYDNGGNDLLLSGYSWHTPWTWTAEKRAEENANAWGAGWGRSVEHEDGDTDTVYVLVFSDSHSKPEYNLGYAWNTYWGARSGLQPGLGYTAMLIARTDIANGWPFPVVLPLFSLRYDKVTLFSTYIPNVGGGVNNGSVFYIFGKIALQ